MNQPHEPLHLLIIEVAVLLLVIQALDINRLAGIDHPLWSSDDIASEPQAPTSAGTGGSSM